MIVQRIQDHPMLTIPRALAMVAAAALSLTATVAYADPPQIVQAYVDGLVRQCGATMTPALAADVVQRVDLNGDKVDDWVVDASRLPCATRSRAFADRGRQITIFLGSSDGRAHAALQREAYGSHLEGKPDTGYSFWVTLGGRDCELDDPMARCDRKVLWQAEVHQLTLAPALPSKARIAK